MVVKTLKREPNLIKIKNRQRALANKAMSQVMSVHKFLSLIPHFCALLESSLKVEMMKQKIFQNRALINSNLDARTLNSTSSEFFISLQMRLSFSPKIRK